MTVPIIDVMGRSDVGSEGAEYKIWEKTSHVVRMLTITHNVVIFLN
jgi:hypothetical protein